MVELDSKREEIVYIHDIVREYVFYVFFENPKTRLFFKRDFLRFFEAAF